VGDFQGLREPPVPLSFKELPQFAFTSLLSVSGRSCPFHGPALSTEAGECRTMLSLLRGSDIP
jgi:hypothetical protein